MVSSSVTGYISQRKRRPPRLVSSKNSLPLRDALPSVVTSATRDRRSNAPALLPDEQGKT